MRDESLVRFENLGMIQAQEDQYLIHTPPSFSVAFVKMGLCNINCIL